MKRMNKTVSNLEKIWQQLDNASGELYNALDNLASMVDISDRMQREADMIDITRIDGLKEEVEEMIRLKKEGATDGKNTVANND